MWCKTCQQDVPAIASAQEQVVLCARCRQPLNRPVYPANSDTADATDASPRAAHSTPSAKPTFPDWELDRELWEARRLVEACEARRIRIDGSHQGNERPLYRELAARRPRRRPEPGIASEAARFWTLCLVGLLGLGIGGTLLGAWAITQRVELWQLGLPVTGVGLTTLLICFLRQLLGMRNQQHDAQAQLEELDLRMDELQRRLAQLSSARSPAQSFYYHLAEGASPKLLLADLKGQLDLLSSRLSES